MTDERNTAPIIAGVVGLIALALVIIGALVVVDHISLTGMNQASVQQPQLQQQQQQQKAASPDQKAPPASAPTPEAPPKAN